MDQVKFVEDSLWKILLGSFLNTLSHLQIKFVLTNSFGLAGVNTDFFFFWVGGGGAIALD